MKINTSHVILNDGKTPGVYSVWSEHRTEAAAIKLCQTLGKNGKQGHTIVVPVSKITDYKTA